MSYDCLFHLLLTHGGLAPSQGLEVRHAAPGKVKNAASTFLFLLTLLSSILPQMTKCKLSFRRSQAYG